MDDFIRNELTETPPPVLYRYLDLNGAAKTLATRTINFTPFDKLDDVLEALPSTLEDGTREEQHEMLRKTLLSDPTGRAFFNTHFGTSYSAEQWLVGLESDSIDIDQMIDNGMTRTPDKTLFEFQKDVSKEHAICSFSKHPDIELMWGLYAQHHRGICLGFNIQKQWELQQVEYSDDPVHFPFLVGHQDVETCRKAMRVLKTKRKCWSFQEEWRVILKQSRLCRGKGVLLAPFRPEALEEIILGSRFTANEREFCQFFHQQFPKARMSRIAIDPKTRTIAPRELPRSFEYDQSSANELMHSHLANLSAYFQSTGFGPNQIGDLLTSVGERLEHKLSESRSENALRLVTHCKTSGQETTMQTASSLVISYSRKGAQFFIFSEPDCTTTFQELSDLFLEQKLNEIVSTLPTILALVDESDIDRQFLSHVFSLTRFF